MTAMINRLAQIAATTLALTLTAGCNLQPAVTSPSTMPPETSPVTTGANTTAVQTLPATTPQTVPVTVPVTKPVTIPVSKPATQPATKPATKPVTQPATKPVTQPATKPPTTSAPETKPSTTASSGEFMDLSNERNEWSYGYPDKWVSDYSGYWKLNTGDLYLTMDLGYEMGFTDVILRTLEEKGVKATFFVTTEYIRDNPAFVRRMLDEGHLVGNHSTKHINMVTLSKDGPEALIENTEKWEAAYKAATGRTSRLYRAPEGVFSKRGLAILEDMGYKTYFWGAAYADYDVNNQPDLDTAREKLYKFIAPGDIILLHPFKTNSELLPFFIDEMRAEGYEFQLVR